MPLVRRAVSGSSASSGFPRSSPYPSPAVLAAGTGNGGSRSRAGGHPKRRRRSECAVRRVLADIDWWRVTPGQLSAPGAVSDDDEAEEPPSPEDAVSSRLATLAITPPSSGRSTPEPEDRQFHIAIPDAFLLVDDTSEFISF